MSVLKVDAQPCGVKARAAKRSLTALGTNDRFTVNHDEVRQDQG